MASYLEGSTDLEKLHELCKKTHKEQAVWFLNAFWEDFMQVCEEKKRKEKKQTNKQKKKKNSLNHFLFFSHFSYELFFLFCLFFFLG